MGNFLNYSNDVRLNRLRAENWIRDTDPANMNPEHDATSEVAKRTAWVSESHVFEVVGRQHLDLLHQSKFIPPGINMLIRFIPAINTFVIKTTDDHAAQKIVIDEVKLRVKRNSSLRKWKGHTGKRFYNKICYCPMIKCK